MRRQDFYYDLPQSLIARYPLPERSASRLLCIDAQQKKLEHRVFQELVDLIHPNDLLVFNNSRVIPARLFAEKSTGGKVEILVERILSSHRVLAHVRASKKLRVGSQLHLERSIKIEVIAKRDELYELQFLDERSKTNCHASEGWHPGLPQTLLEILNDIGHVPIPPYFQRDDEAIDRERYQTIYAKHDGSVAAPTAGLHFDAMLLQQLNNKGVEFSYVTLHVGAGTFQPVRVDELHEHRMHHEYLEVPEETCEKIKLTKKNNGRVIAVGTTSVRSIETAAQSGEVKPYYGETNLFIYPGYRFQCIDALITNFHLPESTLLMLVCALGGYDDVMRAYREAIENQYRFFSYGDAMMVMT